MQRSALEPVDVGLWEADGRHEPTDGPLRSFRHAVRNLATVEKDLPSELKRLLDRLADVESARRPKA